MIIVGDLDIFGCRIIVRPSESDEETEIIECERFRFMESLSFRGDFGRNGLDVRMVERGEGTLKTLKGKNANT